MAICTKRTIRTAAAALAIAVILLGHPAMLRADEEPKDNTDDAVKAKRRPDEFFSVFNFGYGGGDLPKEPEKFEALIKKVAEAGYNTVMCNYTDQRVEICKKYDVKILVDLLGPEHHVYKSPDKAKALCEKLRGNPVILGYHLWSDRFGNTGAGRARDIRNVHEWDPTHITYIGTYKTGGMNHLVGSDFLSWYDFHWKRGPDRNFPHLLTAWRLAKANDIRIGRFIATDPAYGRTGDGNIARHMYTLNTSIACGLKGCMWFIGTRTIGFNREALDWKWTGLGLDIIKVHKEFMPLKKELPKLGNPTAIYSTPITKTLKNRELPEGTESMMPPAMENHKFPQDFWIQPVSGEFVMGVFKDDRGRDAIFVANHNTYAEQDVKLKLARNVRVSIFNRKEEKWQPLEAADGTISFKLGWGGGELLRFEE